MKFPDVNCRQIEKRVWVDADTGECVNGGGKREDAGSVNAEMRGSAEPSKCKA